MCLSMNDRTRLSFTRNSTVFYSAAKLFHPPGVHLKLACVLKRGSGKYLPLRPHYLTLLFVYSVRQKLELLVSSRRSAKLVAGGG